MLLQKVYFRADADARIGYGHFIRSLALAEMLKDTFDCYFFTQEPTDYQNFEISKVCKLVELPANDSKLKIFLNYLTGEEIVFLDNYYFSSDYQKQIKEIGCKLICIGSNDRHYYADVLINYVISDKDEFSTEKYTRFCLGVDWTILRKPFLSINKINNSRKNGIVICFGGTDPNRLTEKIVYQLKKYNKKLSINIIATSQFGKNRINALQEIGCYTNIDITAEKVAHLFSVNMFALVSSSTIALEALACGIKVFAGYYIENQRLLYESLTKGNYIIPLGNLMESNIPDRIIKTIETNNQITKKKFNLTHLQQRYIELFRSL